MLYFEVNALGNVVSVTDKRIQGDDKEYVSRWDFKTLRHAEHVAESASKATGETYLAVDSGPWVSPRFDVIRAMKVGEPVSYGFNGDYYPDGEIVKIGKDHRIITTSSGARYYRRKLTASWIKTGGTWALVSGHHNDKNPEF